MATKHDINIFQLREAVNYDPLSGHLSWAHTAPDFYPANIRARWHWKMAGAPAFASLDRNGYGAGSFMGVSLRAHQVAWAMVFEEWPAVIDHIDGNRMNNAIGNLRRADRVENTWNRKSRSGSCSNFVGVFPRRLKRSGEFVWISQIQKDGRKIGLGVFKSEVDAALAYDAANWARSGHFARLNFPEVQHDEHKAGDWDSFVNEYRRMRESNSSAASSN